MSIFSKLRNQLVGSPEADTTGMALGVDWLSGAPRITIHATGAISVQTDSAKPLAEAIAKQTPELLAVINGAKDKGLDETYIKLPGGERFWVAAFKAQDKIEIIAHDTSVQEQVTDALIHSRALLQRLLANATDFAFEVNRDGLFSFLHPTIFLGHETAAWIGGNPTNILWPDDQDGPARSPFLTRKAQTFEAVSVSIGPERRYFDFQVQPHVDADGIATGEIFGTARDVTQSALIDRAQRLERLGQTIQSRLTTILLEADNAGDLLDRAANALQAALRADGVFFATAMGRDVIPVSVAGDLPEKPIAKKEIEQNDKVLAHLEHDGRDMLIMALHGAKDTHGSAIIHRDTTLSPWSKEEEELLTVVQATVSAAYEKAQMIDKLEQLANQDGLTGLLNRRAFEDLVNRRLSQTRQAPCALIYIDLDHFKEVNDTLGHQAGDEALQMVADHLKKIIRPSDLAGRLGGDEFVVWLDGVKKDAAAAKGRSLIAYMPEVRTRLGRNALRLSVSIGICPIQPFHEVSLKTLGEQADRALYDVKRAGRAGIAFADVISDTITLDK